MLLGKISVFVKFNKDLDFRPKRRAMITINIKIDLFHENPLYSESRKSWNAVLTLKTIPRLSTDGPIGQKFIGEWMSGSSYIGKEMTGKYLIKRISQWDKHERGRDGEFYDRRLQNPVGWFFDSRSNVSPFLSLYTFFPGIMPNKDGFGMLDYKPQIISSGVEWSQA